MSGMMQYLKNSVWDMVLCAAASGTLLHVLCTGFYSTRPFQQQPWVIAALAVVGTFALFLCARSLTSAVVGGALIALATAAAAFTCWTLSGSPSILDDVAGNNATFVLLAALTIVLVFLLSRRKATTLVLAAGGLILCAVLEYLYFLGHVVPTLAFGVLAAALYAYRNYQVNLLDSDSEKISFGTTTAASLLTAVLACTLGAGLFCVVIAPLNPPHVVVKLITKHMRLDTEEVRGIGDKVSVVNDKLFSMNTSDIVINASGDGDLDQQQNMDDIQSDPQSKDQSQDAGSAMSLNSKSDQDSASAISMHIPDWAWLAMPIAIILLLAAIIGGRKALRKRKLDRIMAQPPKERVQSLFLYYLGAFDKMRMPLPGSNTLQEYRASANSALCSFEQTADAPEFDQVIDIYNCCAYGPGTPSDDEVGICRRYYDDFHRRARKKVGPLKYVPLFFRI